MPKITAHKGGRTAQLHCRIKPETKELLEQFAERHFVTVADVIETLANRYIDLTDDGSWTCPSCKFSNEAGRRECQWCSGDR